MTKMKMKKGKARSRVGRARLAQHLGHVSVFDREFFGEMLPSMVGTCPRPEGTKAVVTVFLGDGTSLDCCGVVALHERYCVLAAYEGLGEDGLPRTADDVGFEAVPYELVLRCSVRAATRPARLGFGELIPRRD
jgi:hypothetical protein